MPAGRPALRGRVREAQDPRCDRGFISARPQPHRRVQRLQVGACAQQLAAAGVDRHRELRRLAEPVHVCSAELAHSGYTILRAI